jgi:hypothetical protein
MAFMAICAFLYVIDIFTRYTGFTCFWNVFICVAFFARVVAG